MKHTGKKVLSLGLFLGMTMLFFSSCYSSYEGRYYHHYHHHHREWYRDHHQPEPAGVNWSADIDIR